MGIASPMELCIKNSTAGDADCERLWFRFLDSVLDVFKRHLGDKLAVAKFRPLHTAMSQILSEIFEAMVKKVAIMSLVEKIRLGYGEVALRDLKQSFLSMLSNYAYEENILRSATHFLMSDITDYGIRILVILARGHLFQTSCGFCSQPLVNDAKLPGSKLVSFGCGHSFHRRCLSGAVECGLCAQEENHKLVLLVSNRGGGAKGKAPPQKSKTARGEIGQAPAEPMTPRVVTETRPDLARDAKRDKILRKMRVFDARKSDEAQYIERIKEKYRR
eukprot:TRINITY_DN1367_c0_g2_i3.p1 TRINITY_DN1367_c0_g2~~TRINITY_DN1367_c0_g2_i3.p1  ORF type:complete len:275 (-),score=62.87 TRINITY_DN1367_c0_g2_i3:41-865(-)